MPKHQVVKMAAVFLATVGVSAADLSPVLAGHVDEDGSARDVQVVHGVGGRYVKGGRCRHYHYYTPTRKCS